jgi:hypothetical protein
MLKGHLSYKFRFLGAFLFLVTATTGMASTQLGFEATTLHHWSGILDGRYSILQLKELFDHDDKFAAPRLRIESTITC